MMRNMVIASIMMVLCMVTVNCAITVPTPDEPSCVCRLVTHSDGSGLEGDNFSQAHSDIEAGARWQRLGNLRGVSSCESLSVDAYIYPEQPTWSSTNDVVADTSGALIAAVRISYTDDDEDYYKTFTSATMFTDGQIFAKYNDIFYGDYDGDSVNNKNGVITIDPDSTIDNVVKKAAGDDAGQTIKLTRSADNTYQADAKFYNDGCTFSVTFNKYEVHVVASKSSFQGVSERQEKGFCGTCN